MYDTENISKNEKRKKVESFFCGVVYILIAHSEMMKFVLTMVGDYAQSGGYSTNLPLVDNLLLIVLTWLFVVLTGRGFIGLAKWISSNCFSVCFD